MNSDTLDRISAMTGLRFVHVESFSIEHMLQSLERREADMSTTLAMNDERKVFLDFSHSYGGAGWVFVGRAGAPQVESLQQLAKRVLVLPTRHVLEAVIRRDHPSIELRSVKTYAQARALVESGEAHATIESETGARLVPLGQLQVGQIVEGQWDPDYLTVRKGQSQLLSILNKALEAFPPAELRALRSKWLNGDPLPTAWQQFAPWAGWGLLAASLCGLLSLRWRRRLAGQVKADVFSLSSSPCMLYRPQAQAHLHAVFRTFYSAQRSLQYTRPRHFVFGLLSGDRMESISLLLGEALSPYQVTLTPSGIHGECRVTLKNAIGAIVVDRVFNQAQLADKRQLTDVVDGLHRDVLIAEGRLEPCVIAALRNAAQDKLVASRN